MFAVRNTIDVKVLFIIHLKPFINLIKNTGMDKHIIRENAGKLWRLLSTDVHRKWNLQEVKELTGFNDLEVASAIGWLAREDKIQFELEHHDTKDKNALLYLMLNVYF